MPSRSLRAASSACSLSYASQRARSFVSPVFGRTTASRLNRALQQKGVESLRKRRATGRPSRLGREQLLAIPGIYTQGAVIHGFPDNRWTTAMRREDELKNFERSALGVLY